LPDWGIRHGLIQENRAQILPADFLQKFFRYSQLS